jgi:TetR/AcrR family transcriptional regulator, cholesterol catabolism regulator
MSDVQKDRILEGAEELFFKAGIRSITMDEIARHLGMSKKTIYLHYKDKDELVTNLVKTRLEEDKCQMQIAADNASNVLEELINMMKCSEEIFSRANPILIHDLQKYHPEAWRQFQGFKAGIVVDSMRSILTRGIEQGYVRPEIDVTIIARMRVWQIELGFNAEVFPPQTFNSWKVQLQFMEHFAYGICTAKGRKLLDNYKNIIEQE